MCKILFLFSLGDYCIVFILTVAEFELAKRVKELASKNQVINTKPYIISYLGI